MHTCILNSWLVNESDPTLLTYQLNLGDTPHTMGPWADEAITPGKPELGKRSTNPNFTKLGDTTEGFVLLMALRFTRIGARVSMLVQVRYMFWFVLSQVFRLRHLGFGARSAHGARAPLPAIEVLSLRQIRQVAPVQ